MRRIVVTGLGAVSPLASGVEAPWARLLAGRSGIRRFRTTWWVICRQGGGMVPSRDDDPRRASILSRLAPKDQRKIDRFILFALAAAEEALAQASWKPTRTPSACAPPRSSRRASAGFPRSPRRCARSTRGVRRLSPFTIPSFLVNLAAGHVSIRHGFKGPLGAPVTACAAGIQAIGDAARLIRANEADIAVCGGTEACMNIVSLGGFAAARTLSTGFNDKPARRRALSTWRGTASSWAKAPASW